MLAVTRYVFFKNLICPLCVQHQKQEIGSCGGINPYTHTARLGSGDLAHHETVQGLIQLLGVSHKETRCGDQAGLWSVRIGIDIALSMAIVTD